MFSHEFASQSKR